MRLLTPARLRALRRMPSLPAWTRRRYAAVRAPWAPFGETIPAELLSAAGVVRHPDLERRAYAEQPLRSFHHDYGGSVVWSLRKLWRSVIPVGPRLMRAIAHVQQRNQQRTGRRTARVLGRRVHPGRSPAGGRPGHLRDRRRRLRRDVQLLRSGRGRRRAARHRLRARTELGVDPDAAQRARRANRPEHERGTDGTGDAPRRLHPGGRATRRKRTPPKASPSCTTTRSRPGWARWGSTVSC